MKEVTIKIVNILFYYLITGAIVMSFVRGLQHRPVDVTDVLFWIGILPHDIGENVERASLGSGWQYRGPYYEERR